MKIGLMNDPAKPVADEIRRIGRAGFDFIDLTLEGPCAFSIDPKEIKPILSDCGLFVVGHTDPLLPWAYPVESVRRACISEFARAAETFAALGAKLMNIHPCYAAPVLMRNDVVEFNRSSLPAIAQAATSFNLSLMLENFMFPFNTVEVMKGLMDAVPGLLLHLDFGHTNLGGDGPDVFLDRLGADLAHVHFSDNRGWADHHMPLGVGTVDWKKMVSALKKSGYDGTITLEVFCSDPGMGMEYCKMSRDYVRRLWDEAG